MRIKIGINGFGRIGRLILRSALSRPETFEIKAINDPFVDAEYMAYMLKYDTVHGKMKERIMQEGDTLIIGENRIKAFSEKDPASIPWKDSEAEIIAEASGAFSTSEKAMGHLAGGAKKVIITAPAKDTTTPTFVYGVNDRLINPEMKVISGASCTTNCAAPILKIISESVGVEAAFMTTVHSTTNTQKTVDAPSQRDWRGGRAASQNIIPSTTGAAKACALVLPELEGRITGMAFRVPTVDVSVVDLTIRTKTDTSLNEICETIKKRSSTDLQEVVGYCDEPLVSSDFIGDSRTSVFDADASLELGSRFFKLVSWYDNEWGYSNKILDLIAVMNGGKNADKHR